MKKFLERKAVESEEQKEQKKKGKRETTERIRREKFGGKWNK